MFGIIRHINSFNINAVKPDPGKRLHNRFVGIAAIIIIKV